MGTLPVALSALLAALNLAGLLPAPELGAVPRCGLLCFIIGIEVILQGPVGEVLAVTGRNQGSFGCSGAAGGLSSRGWSSLPQ